MRKINNLSILKSLLMVVGVFILAAAAGNKNAAASYLLNDLNIKDAVEDEIIVDQVVEFTGIQVKCLEGIVTLEGQVQNLLAKERAANIAQTVKGVRSVVNKIKIAPTVLKTDETLRNDIKDALLMDPATESYEVNVRVKDKKVTLTGTVESWREKELAEKVAKGIAGVKALENKITVDYQSKRTDMEIKADIEQALQWDTLVDHILVDVNVNNGKVTFTGTVGSAAEKTRLYKIAWVAGVKEINLDGLEVKRWARDDDLRKDKYVIKKDENIKNAVQKALLYDPRVLAANVKTHVNNGVITLRGQVDHLKAKRAAAQDARNTVGVLTVKNRLNVSPLKLVSDEEIEKRVRDAFARDVFVESYEITVDVVAGVSNLNGAVDSFYEKMHVDDVASKVTGVLAVDNNLVVSDPYDPYIYDPHVDPYYTYDYEWYRYTPGQPSKSDWQIQQDIQDELWWSPFVDANQVNVSVDDGVAVLTGAVDSWPEYHAATENALEGGATVVDNDLSVNPWMN